MYLAPLPDVCYRERQMSILKGEGGRCSQLLYLKERETEREKEKENISISFLSSGKEEMAYLTGESSNNRGH